MTLAYENPFLWLQSIEQLAHRQAKGLPRQEQVVQKSWKGIAFRVGDARLLADLTDIREIIACPKVLAKVPGAKPWVRGIANIRGLLWPVIDLQLCLGSKKPTIIDNRTRLMIISQGGVSSGILVDEVIGIKHFMQDHMKTDAQPGGHWYDSFSSGLFDDGEQVWTVFNIHILVKSREFLEAAL